MKYRFLKSVAVMVFAACFNLSEAQELRGLVFDNIKEPIPGVGIFVDGEKISETNSCGVFVISKPFRLTMKIKMEHFKLLNASFQMMANDETYQLTSFQKA